VFLQNKNLIASRIHLNPIVNTGLPVPVNRESFFFAAENPETETGNLDLCGYFR
jgi:hypothetical protein